MNRLTFGVIAGTAFGALTVALMLPMSFPDRRAALIGAFVNRFGIGFLTHRDGFRQMGSVSCRAGSRLTAPLMYPVASPC